MELTISIDPGNREEIDAAIEALARLHPDRLAPPAESAIRAVDDAEHEAPETPVAAPPADDRGSEVPTPRLSSTPPPGAPASRIDAAPAERRRLERQEGKRGKRGAQRDRVLEYIRKHPGVTGAQLHEELEGMPKSTVSQVTASLARQHKIRSVPKGKSKAHFPFEADLLPADADGAKGGQEAKIVECLLAADGPLPSGEISLRTGIRSDQVPSICAAMHRRRVISQVPPKAAHLPVRWQPIKHPKTMSDRAAA